LRAADGWRRTPPTERIQYLFAFKQKLEERFDAIARTITLECGKTIGEARGELRRGIENVEVATGIPSMAMGYNVEDIASGIDEMMIRQPLGVVAAITPFNFPGMIPLWFMPYALACGNCFILKPSERVPMTMHKVFELLDSLGLPPGVVSLVNGGRRPWTRCSTTPTSAPSRSSGPRRSRSTCTRARRRRASASSARGAPRTRSS
jgi:malonate-semialdehyde dehydrogenase (acetylating) / methylmalonate-semialdehyde dehydrogenase